MKIISKYKDFYDHISYVYGVDDKIVYIRDKNKVEIRARSFPGYNRLSALNNRLSRIDRRQEASIVVVVDKIFFVVKNIGTNEEYVLDADDDLLREGWLFRDSQPYSSEEILSMTKLVGAPVYRIVRFDWRYSDNSIVAVIAEQTPRLSEIEGIVNKLGVEQTYQNISYALANQLRDSPDIIPPVAIDDKYKIVAAGFDLKQSFRHRK